MRLIEVGGQAVGINQLDDVIETVRQAQKYNHIPRSVEAAYAEALWREYTKE